MKKYEEIVVKYPLLFEGISDQEPFALFGFECDIGWYNIINNACLLFYVEYKRHKRQYEYEKECLDNFDSYLKRRRTYDTTSSDSDIKREIETKVQTNEQLMEEAMKQLPNIVQVKEKFGTLRFYIDNGNRVSNAIANYAEAMSEVTCEKCGNAGITYETGWHKTLCKQHAIERYGEETVSKYKHD
jgi:hypothetical protein